MKHKFSKSRKYSKFIDHLNHSFTNLADLWNRIGFNSIVKAKRLDSVFKKLIDTIDGIYEAEEELEDKIQQNIDANRSLIQKLCIELGYENDLEYAKDKSLYEEDRLLVDLKNRLLNEKRLDDSITDLKLKIFNLWNELEINNHFDDRLFNKYSKSILLENLQNEYNRCLNIKQAKLEALLEQYRNEIELLSKKMYLNLNEYQSEDTLQVYNKLQDKYVKYNCLFDKTNKWLQLWEEFIDFEERTKDPLRFKVRGYNGFEEEKQRKRFQQSIPRLEDELKQLAQDYYAKEGSQYTIYGQLWSQFINSLKENYNNYKKFEKIEKQRAKDALISLKTPSPIAKKKLKRYSSYTSSENRQLKRTSFCIGNLTDEFSF